MEEWVGPQHPARFVLEFVESMDLGEFGIEQSSGGSEGRPYYGPKIRKVRSTRKLEEACRSDVGFIWLSSNCIVGPLISATKDRRRP